MKKYTLILAIMFASVIFAETSGNIITQSINQPDVNIKKLSEDKRTLVIELLQLVNAKKQSQQVLDSMIQTMPLDVQATFKEALNADEMLKLVIPVYERYLTVDDLKNVIVFYRSPAGKKLLEAQPKIMKESMIVMKVYVQKKLSERLNLEKKDK